MNGATGDGGLEKQVGLMAVGERAGYLDGPGPTGVGAPETILNEPLEGTGIAGSGFSIGDDAPPSAVAEDGANLRGVSHDFAGGGLIGTRAQERLEPFVIHAQ